MGEGRRDEERTTLAGGSGADAGMPRASVISAVRAAIEPGSTGAGRPLPEILAAAVDHVREGVCVTTAELDDGGPRIVYVNPAFTAMTGYDRFEVIGLTPRILQGPATDRRVLARLRGDLREGRAASAEVVNYRRDGSAFVMQLSVVPIGDGAGTTTHYLGLQRDGGLERIVEATRDILLAALKQTTGAIAVLDVSGRITYANPAALQLARMPASRLLGKSGRVTGLTPRRLRVYREMLAALESRGEWRGEYESSARSGEPRQLAVSVTRVETADPSARFVVDVRDVGHQRRLEYLAEATNMVHNLGYIFAGLRHELGNPINSMKTALTLLRQTLPTLPRARVEDYLDRVLVEMGRVEYLLRSLRTFNSMNQPTLEPVALGPFMESFADIIRPDVERRGVSLRIQVEDDIGEVTADPRALHHVMLNLITNALDALAGRDDGQVQVSVRRGVTHVRILVSDNGPGIPGDQRQRLFKPFHTTKNKGTGLGLAITRKLVTLMRGTIELEPAHGWPTTFTITLDAALAVAPERREPTHWPPPLGEKP